LRGGLDCLAAPVFASTILPFLASTQSLYVSADLPAIRVRESISEFKMRRSRAEWGFHEVTSIGARQKTWQKKTAEECRIVQEIAGRRHAKTPENVAENGVLPTYTHIPIELRGQISSIPQKSAFRGI